MEAPRPPAPAKDTGLPPGVRVGPLGRRFLAFVIDSVVPAIAVVLILVSRRGTGGASVALLVIAVVLGLAWAGVCWQQLAVRAASPGMRVLKLQLVGFFDGRPIGWGRVFLRWLIFAALAVTGLGLLLLLVSIFMSPRQQGWHDRAASAVVIVERALPPRRKPATSRPASARPAPAQAGPGQAGPGQAGPGQAGPGQRGPAQQRPAAIATATAGSGASGRPAPVASPSPVAGDPALAPELAPVAGDPDLAGDTDPGTVGAPVNGGGSHRTILEGWVAELDDGREIAVRGLVLLGRNPQPGEGEADAELVKLSDESRTVSKTHLALGVDDAGLFVVDRGSTNGSTITPPGRPPVPAGAFHAMSVSEGSVVSIGDHWVRIRRNRG